MICQKLCRNNLSKWGSLEVKFRDKLHLFCLDLFAAGSRTTTPVRTRIGGASWRLWRCCRGERSVGGSMFFVVWNKWGRTHAAIFSIFSMYLTMAIYGELWTDVIYPNLGHAFWEHVFDIGWIDEVCETIGWVGWGSLTHIPAELCISSMKTAKATSYNKQSCGFQKPFVIFVLYHQDHW
jgi:hypothetical protein